MRISAARGGRGSGFGGSGLRVQGLGLRVRVLRSTMCFGRTCVETQKLGATERVGGGWVHGIGAQSRSLPEVHCREALSVPAAARAGGFAEEPVGLEPEEVG